MVDSVEFITYREAKDILGKDENVSITNGDDLKPYAYGIARPVSDAYAAMRRNGKALLYTLLFQVSRRAYEIGVRDAYEGRLSEDLMSQISEFMDGKEDEHFALRDFYDDVRDA